MTRCHIHTDLLLIHTVLLTKTSQEDKPASVAFDLDDTDRSWSRGVLSWEINYTKNANWNTDYINFNSTGISMNIPCSADCHYEKWVNSE